MDEPEVDYLELADWRRRISELYAQVRAERDPASGHELWRATRERLYREHPASPGRLEVPFAAGPRRLALFWLPEYSGGLFLAFRDATNGRETYGGGRYLLDTGKGSDLGGDPAAGTIVVDFNFAYQPSCAFDPRWSCPLSAPENRLDLEVRAGERID